MGWSVVLVSGEGEACGAMRGVHQEKSLRLATLSAHVPWEDPLLPELVVMSPTSRSNIGKENISYRRLEWVVLGRKSEHVGFVVPPTTWQPIQGLPTSRRHPCIGNFYVTWVVIPSTAASVRRNIGFCMPFGPFYLHL